MLANLVAACSDADGQAVLAYLHAHMQLCEDHGLRVSIRSAAQLVQVAHHVHTMAYPDGSAVLRVWGTRRPWLHLSRATVEDAVQHPALLKQLLWLLRDARVDAHYALTGEQLIEPGDDEA